MAEMAKVGQEPRDKSVLEQAVARGIALLPAEEADKAILALHQQVGDLECDNALKDQTLSIYRSDNEFLKERNAVLELAIKQISAKCVHRLDGWCDLGCVGRIFCDVTGLRPFNPEPGKAETAG